jgi:outer membrane protein assembly factor BamB
LAVTSCVYAEDDWPQFRGPKRDNHSPDKGLLTEWPENGPPVVWKAKGLGSGFSSLAVTGGKIFTMGNKGKSSFVVALDQKDGNILWSAEVGKEGGNLGCTPTVDGDRVYAIGQHGDLVCLDTSNGDVQWRKNFHKDFGGHCGGWMYTESPLVDGDKLVCTPGGKDALIVALNKKTGDVIWQCPCPAWDSRSGSTAGYASIVVAEVGGIRQYVQLVASGLVGVAAKDGRFLWRYDQLADTTANIPTPIVLGDDVFCSAGYNQGGALLHLTKQDDEVKAEPAYFKHELKNKHGGLVVVGDYVYGDHDDSGRPFCAEVKTGKLMWRKDKGNAGHGSAAVTYADGHLYFLYDNGVAALVEASQEKYKEISAFQIPNAQRPTWAHPVVIGGKLYLRSGDVLWCYDVKKH